MDIHVVTQARKNSARIKIADGHEDMQAVHSFMHECLVPLLAKEFFRIRNANASSVNTTETSDPTTGPFVREGGQ